MTYLLSPTDCYYCRSNTNIQRIKFPCDCLIYAHPDCYNSYVLDSRERREGRWKLKCPECNIEFNLVEYQHLQLNIQRDDEMMPLTRRDMNREQCKLCAILSVQSTLLIGLCGFVLWAYAKLIMGVL